ncbi:MAG TPA: hypothetical protein VGO62_12235, partial [Myxococcota bacterium]
DDSPACTISVTLPKELPCLVVVDGTDANGRGAAPVARVYWPKGTPLVGATHFDFSANSTGTSFSPGVAATFGLAHGDDGADARAWAVDGNDDVIADGYSGSDDEVPFAAPATATSFVIAVERRVGGASGGVQYAQLSTNAENDDGTVDHPPVARGGRDRIVQPGGRFRFDTSASFDQDGDALTIDIAQVLGPTAAPDPVLDDVFVAPSADVLGGVDATLLFHVVANDGLVSSQPDPVRVIVSASAADVPPVLVLPAARFVTPGQTFLVDGSSADDPDSGVIADVTISQAADDPVRLAPFLSGNPVDAPFVQLTAGNAGEVYHFTITAFDDEGLGVTVDQSVTVEDAGPYVDPARGDDVTGNGTSAAPFATVAVAVATAVRHELPELLLAEGLHAELGGVLPDRVSLRGEQHFDGSEYVDGGAVTELPIGPSGLGINDGHIAAITAHLSGGSISLAETSALEDVVIDEGADQTAPIIAVAADAVVTVLGATLNASGAHDDAAITLGDSATVTVANSSLSGSPGTRAVGIHCTHAALALDGAVITGGASATSSVGVLAEQGCTLDTAGAIVSGGDRGTATGIEAHDASITLDDASQITGATGDADSGTALVVSGRDRSALVRGILRAGADGANIGTALGIDASDAQLSVDAATIEASGVLAGTAVSLNGGVLVMSGGTLTGSGTALASSDDVDAQVVGAVLSGATAVSCPQGTVSFTGATINATIAGIDADGALVGLVRTSIVVDAAGDVAAVGVHASSVAASDSELAVSGNAPVGVLSDLDAQLLRTSVAVVALGDDAGHGVDCQGQLTLANAFVSVVGRPGDDVAVLASAGALLKHATIRSDGVAVSSADPAELELDNSVLGGSPGLLVPKAAPWKSAVALAFDSAAVPLVQTSSSAATSQNDLDNLQCDSCVIVDVSALVDDTGHLLAGDNPLVDAGDPATSLPDDIDGDARPQGPLPDIGCDERS